MRNASECNVSFDCTPEHPANDTESPVFEELYNLHYGPVFNYVLRTVMNRHVAEDITSEAFFRAYRQFASFQPRRGPFSTWIFTIATNHMRDYFRKNRRAGLLEQGDIDCEGLLASPAASTGAGSELDRFESYRLLHDKIRLLKPIYRIAITLYYFEGRNLREIAEILGEMQSTVRWRLFRARGLLAKKLNHSREDLR